MKHYKFLLLLLACSLFINYSHSQKLPGPVSNPQKQVIRVNPVKADTNDPNQKALKKFSKEKMFNVTTPQKPMTPEETRAMNLADDGSKKGKAGDYNGAIADFTKSLELSKNATVYVKRGYAYLLAGTYGLCISDATEALNMKESYPRAYFIRGLAKYESGDYKGAGKDLEIFIRKDSTNAIAFNYMAAIAFMNQDYPGALRNYNEVIRIDPTYPDIFTNRGMMRHYNRDFKGAIADYNDALKIDSNNVKAYNNRGAAKLVIKNYQGALEDFSKAISLDANYSDAYDNRARVKQAMGDLYGACADWRQAFSLGLKSSQEMMLKYCK